MFSKKSILVFFIFSSILAAAVGFYFLPSAPKIIETMPEQISFPKGDPYIKEWKKVDSLTNKGLTSSALNVVEGIYSKAKSENNSTQIVKAVIHRIKLESQMEEYSLQKSITKMNEEIKNSKFPLTPVLHSMLAELYWSYYQDNRWRFYNRTETVSFKMDDIATWDLKTIVEHTAKHYQLSLKSEDLLKRTPLGIYDDVIINDRPKDSKPVPTRKLRPTLFDFLAHRAVDFYINEEPDIIQPAYKFELNSEEYFKNYESFVKLNLTSDPSSQGNKKVQDSLNSKYCAIKILRDLMAFHSNDNNPEVLIDVDLKRLKFIRNKSILEIKDSLYVEALKNLEKKFLSDPASAEVSYEIAETYNEKGNMYQPLVSDANKWNKKTAVEICDNTIKRFPDSYGANNCKYLEALIKTKGLQLNVEDGNLPSKPFRARVQYSNLNKIYLRIIKDDADKFTTDIQNLYGENFVKKILEEKAVKEWFLDLPSDGDFQSHSVEIKIPELPLGHYVILAGTDKSFSYSKDAVAYANCFVTEMTYIQRRASDGGYDFMVFDRETGNPLKGVQAQLWYPKYNNTSRKYGYEKGANYITDEEGAFHLTSSLDESQNYFVEFIKGNDRIFSDNGFYIYKNYKPEKKMDLKTFFFTDRGIYRPGQIIYFKGILLETDGETNKIKPKQNVKVTLYDANYQSVASLNLISNEYGTFNGSFTLPQNVMNGDMQITDEHGMIYFSVEDYKRPRFEITSVPIKGVYRLNENIQVHGKAQSYAGANIVGAQVKYRVVRNATFPYYDYFFTSRYFGDRSYCPSSPQMEITGGMTTTNDTGGFAITFKAIPDASISKKYFPIYTYTIYSDVTDITGETHSKQEYVSVGYNAMKMDVNISDYVSKDSVPKYNINTTNLNGEFEPAHVKVQVWKQNEPNRMFRKRLWSQSDKYLMTKAEYYSSFPNDVYADEDKVNKWEKGAQVFSGEFDTQKDKDELLFSTISQWQNGVYVLEATTKDKFGEEVKDVKYFTVYSSAGSSMPVNDFDWFTLLRGNGEPGTNASFLLGTKAPNAKVLFEIEHKNEIIKKEWLTLNAEQRKIEIPIEEKYRGNFAYHITFVKNGRCYQHDGAITVPYTNKELDIQFETFRNKLLPGQKEEWKIKIKDKKGDKLAAEMLATLYDASLDAFRPNDWYFNIYNSYYASRSWETNAVAKNNFSTIFSKDWNVYPPLLIKYYDRLNWFEYYTHGGGSYRYNRSNSQPYMAEMDMVKSAPPSPQEEVLSKISGKASGVMVKEKAGGNNELGQSVMESKKDNAQSLGQISARKNLSETAFFFPQLQTDENGNVIINFTVPEALTKWKMMGFAHTKDLKYGQIQKELVTQKELMVTPHAPRFFREGDHITFTGKVDNLSSADMSGTAQLFLSDAVTMKDITSLFVGGTAGAGVTFLVKKGQSAPLEWNLIIPEGISAVTYKVVAKSGNVTDGEESAVPVLTNRMLVTESMPLSIRSKETKTFKFEKFISQNNNSATLRNHKLTLEFSANPAWYAVQSLPYIMEYPYDCAEQTFSRFYANSIASHIANSSPKIKAVFDSWKSQSPETFLSNLEKNQELKSLLLEETPWVLDAKDESERKKRVGLLFDFNKMSNELNAALIKLQKMQLSNGGWPWFDGMPDDRFITQHIITGMGHLDHLGIKNIREDSKVWDMITKAVHYMDDRMREDYEQMYKLRLDQNNINYDQIQYLYARSYFLGGTSSGNDIPIENRNQKAFDYYKSQAQKYWLSKGRYMDGMIALALYRFGDKKTSSDIMKSLKENALHNDEMGMYWKENYEGFYWYEAPIESQALLIEAFDEVANDKKSVDDLRVWLLKSKQTQNWESTKATTEAVYALLLRGTDWLSTESNVDISLGDIKIDPKNMPDVKAEAGTGYFKTTWNGTDIKPQMGNVSITKKDEGVSWGALYWQYFEQLDKITPSKTPLQLVKKLFVEKNTATGPVIEPISENTQLKPGDKLKVRIELRVDRDMQYVHMKDMRASGFEPVNVFSTYKYQDGLSYYESTRDASTNFFFSYLPKGTYVFEYPLTVSHSGDFSNGISSIQCMYAPEFTSHSEGIRVKVGK